MLEQEYQKMFEEEEKNWYFRGKRSVVFDYLERTGKKDLKILDVGCGTGINLQKLGAFGQAFGIDVSRNALNFCQQRSLANLGQASIENLPFKNNSFDLVTCLDVLYHKGVKSNEQALKEIDRVSKTGAMLVLTESAFKSLWSEHDQAVQAKTRYTIQDFKELLAKTSFKITKSSYWNFFLLLPVFLLKKLSPPKSNPAHAKSNVLPLPGLINFILSKIIALESVLMSFISFPIGVDLFIVARKEIKQQRGEDSS